MKLHKSHLQRSPDNKMEPTRHSSTITVKGPMQIFVVRSINWPFRKGCLGSKAKYEALVEKEEFEEESAWLLY